MFRRKRNKNAFQPIIPGFLYESKNYVNPGNKTNGSAICNLYGHVWREFKQTSFIDGWHKIEEYCAICGVKKGKK